MTISNSASAVIALNRFGLGARSGEAAPDNPHRWLLDQLARFDPKPAALADLPATTRIIEDLAEGLMQRREARQEMRAAGQASPAANLAPPAPMMQPGMATPAKPPMPAPNAMAGYLHDIRQDYIAAVGARTNAALVTTTPFVERLVHFWANHFALSVDKIEITGLAGAFEFEAIRPHVLGTFADMLAAAETHPAMLLYLDQAQSVGPGSQAGQAAARNGRKGPGLNENLAREILELHTLGVRSGYSQADVTEFARALTGRTVAGVRPNRILQDFPPGYAFADRLHEPGDRMVLGKRYAGGGEAQGRAILADLATHPATAHHIATKLARHFAADDPPPALVARLETAFLRSGGDLPTVYRALVEAPEPWTTPSAKFRDPWDWGVAAMRAVGAPTIDPRIANGLFQQLGQPVWKPGSPAGYDDIAASWAAPDALLRRVEAANRIAAKAGAIDARTLAPALFPGTLSPATGTAIAQAEAPAQALALLLVSPDMMRR
jgi:uncharacterized protein (DUF1800 family)